MKIEGTQKIDAPRERIFAALTDPAVLQKCIPGCEQMEKTGENQYNARLTAGVGPVKGVFTATVSLQDIIAAGTLQARGGRQRPAGICQRLRRVESERRKRRDFDRNTLVTSTSAD